jgi:protocatechuate 3,4-dioxygenase beta subunit
MPSDDLKREYDSTKLSRRGLLGLAANTVLTAIVSQSFLSCKDAAADSGTGTCVLTAALTEGPYFIDEKLNRSDIRADPVTGAISAGMLLALTFNVMRVDSSACTPLTGAYLDVWHCDAAGVYSDVSGSGSGHRFLRGYQITDANGVAQFATVYPGWYQGRAVHTHFKLRIFAGASTTYEFTSQFFFDEGVTDTVHTTSPYSNKSRRDTLNSNDGIYNSLSSSAKTALTLNATKSGDTYSGVINLGVKVG